MLKDPGVYTAKCPKCGRSMLMHLASDGSVSPSECPECHTEFAGMDNGAQRNTFVGVVKTGKSKIVVVEEVEEKPKDTKEIKDSKKKFETIKPNKDSFKMWSNNEDRD